MKADSCPHHPTPVVEAPAGAPPTLPRDLHAVSWWVLERLLHDEIDPRRASAMRAMVGTIAQLGPEERDEQEMWREAQLRGLVMHGIPPRTPEEWELAERVFDDDALAELHRWEAMFKAPAPHDALGKALWPHGGAP